MPSPLYQEIAESIRQAIFYGELQPGDELLPVRDMSLQWDCAPGTVQRAYRELAEQGLISSRPGQGTRVAATSPASEQARRLRRAGLVNEAEAFLLRVMGSGYSVAEVEHALHLALDRWRALAHEEEQAPEHELRFVGSHDPSLALVAERVKAFAPGYTVHIAFAGSLGGLIALAEGKADVAGCHLWDEQTDSYNAPFVRRLLPGQRIALLTLAHRHLGLIFAPDSPATLTGLSDLTQPHVRFINRQPGAGTRVWLDAQLRRAGIAPTCIAGYNTQVMTHSDVARAVAEGRANVGIGIKAAAQAYGLAFEFLIRERYDLVIPEAAWSSLPIQRLAAWMTTSEARDLLGGEHGYDVDETGQVTWVE